jgi:hypothetical protein
MELNFFIDEFNIQNYKSTHEYVPLSAQTAYLKMGQDALKVKFDRIYVNTIVKEQWIKHWWCLRLALVTQRLMITMILSNRILNRLNAGNYCSSQDMLKYAESC